MYTYNRLPQEQQQQQRQQHPQGPSTGKHAAIAQAQRHRDPLAPASAVNHHHQNNANANAHHNYNMPPPPTPPKNNVAEHQAAKPPGSPPLPRQNAKTRPPSPPKVITDTRGRMQFNRVGFLGEGGFARVYEVQDPKGHRLACKVVTKSALKTKKAKTKLYAEIKIHRSLSHPNIVTFQDCFEDDANVYITLDLCPSGSLMDLLRRRRRFTEPETRFFLLQLIGACHYLHTHQVIHRDLKLGNLFLDGKMNVQVGDFGLAALIERGGREEEDDFFEVDVWSVGVILYTLVVGRPPFQTKEVKEIYKRIRDNEYEFPPERHISSAVKHLIQEILTPNPAERPTLHEIVDHPFFVQGPVPAFVPTSAHDGPPDFRSITKRESEANYRNVRRASGLDEDYASEARDQPLPPTAAPPAHTRERERQPEPQSHMGNGGQQRRGGGAMTHTASIAQQEKEFQKAVQPGSPISALLSSARTPLMVGPAVGGMGMGARESPLMRKLQAASREAGASSNGGSGTGNGGEKERMGMGGERGRVGESPLGRRSVVAREGGVVEIGIGRGESLRRRGGVGLGGNGGEEGEGEEEEKRRKELEAQKARIVAQMAPVKEEDEEDDDDDASDEEGMGDVGGRRRGERERDEMGEDGEEEERPLPALPRTRMGMARERERENVPPSLGGSTVRVVSAGKGKGRERELGRLPMSGSTASLALQPSARHAPGIPTSSSTSHLPSSSKFAGSTASLLTGTGTASSANLHALANAAGAPNSASNGLTSNGLASGSSGAPKLNGFDAAAQMLELGFAARAAGRVFANPAGGAWPEVEEEKVFIVSWVDYCNKYGMGYALTDGAVGVHFNDSTSLVLSAGKRHFDYIASRRAGTVYVRKSYGVEEYPEELKSKVYLLKHFEKYIMERLYGEYEYTYVGREREKGMEWVQKYLRMKHVIVFKMSHDVLQFNFYDHSKLILSSHGLSITHIDKAYQKTHHKLVDVLAYSLNTPAGATPEEVRFMGKLVDKLKYCKEVLGSIRSASAGEGGEGGSGVPRGVEAEGMVERAAEREREKERVAEKERERGLERGMQRRAMGSKVSLR
ncbi:other/PLK protein kinase [Ephemerocybe angulata]|uniref:Serine/threonine-protein kinase n=1 Tax=Ephemerocybe angulata TaxID=980116 RepID=A0A8H6IHH2_9AGAR|nr:other/PLK protein kinase [Tulosesus angulatus]